jgi:hypothetical protein
MWALLADPRWPLARRFAGGIRQARTPEHLFLGHVASLSCSRIVPNCRLLRCRTQTMKRVCSLRLGIAARDYRRSQPVSSRNTDRAPPW